jgi:hypothetical protein
MMPSMTGHLQTSTRSSHFIKKIYSKWIVNLQCHTIKLSERKRKNLLGSITILRVFKTHHQKYNPYEKNYENYFSGQVQWLMTVIPATWKAEIRRKPVVKQKGLEAWLKC